MNRQLFLEWFPQIVYNHHQTGPPGAVIFMPPFRDPVQLQFRSAGSRSVSKPLARPCTSAWLQKGKAGSTQRTGADYSTWWNGGLRPLPDFHNMIGILTENRQPDSHSNSVSPRLSSCRMAIARCRSHPQIWHYR